MADSASEKPAAAQNGSAATEKPTTPTTEKSTASQNAGTEKTGPAVANEANQDGVSTDKTEDVKAEEEAQDDGEKYPKGMPLVLIITSLCLAVFLVALDQTIIAPALGAITADYHSVKDIVSNLLPRFLDGEDHANAVVRDGVS